MDALSHRRFTPQPTHSALRWPNGYGLAISFVLNIEEGAEFSLTASDERNEAVHEITHEISNVPDFCMETHFEYGARAGYQRIAQRFIQAKLPLTLNVCGRALACTPWVAEDAVSNGWEMCGHGWRWEPQANMDPDTERATIERTSATIARLGGTTPTGWHCKSSPSVHTRRLLQEMGFLYDSNDYGGEVPFIVPRADGSPYVVLPYAFDTNDMRFFDRGGFVRARDFSDYVIDAIDALQAEARHAPRLLTIGLHPRILGRPARINALDTILHHVNKAGDDGQPCWIATRQDIARFWLTVE